MKDNYPGVHQVPQTENLKMTSTARFCSQFTHGISCKQQNPYKQNTDQSIFYLTQPFSLISLKHVEGTGKFVGS
jgi:hypothetical protein